MVLVGHELWFAMASSSAVLLSGYVKVNGKDQAQSTDQTVELHPTILKRLTHGNCSARCNTEMREELEQGIGGKDGRQDHFRGLGD